MYLVGPIAESQSIIHVKAPSKQYPDHQSSSDHRACHSISTSALDCHKTSTNQRQCHESLSLSIFSIVIQYGQHVKLQTKGRCESLVSQAPPDPSDHDVVSSMEIFSRWWKGSPHPQHTIWCHHTLRMKADRLEGYHTFIRTQKSTKNLRALGR